jgi:hypothetical protein
MGNSLVKTSDNGYVVTGSTGLDSSSTDMFIAKFDDLGTLTWDHTLGSNYSVLHHGESG